jgi:hypothetical protein
MVLGRNPRSSLSSRILSRSCPTTSSWTACARPSGTERAKHHFGARPSQTAVVRATAAELLSTYAGVLMCDGYDAYLTLAIFAHGFLRFHCDGCRRDLFVAFACKGRGICQSCGARRMCNTAAHIVDRVLPAAPVRQWVLSLPFELRRLAAFHASEARALGRWKTGGFTR